MPVETKTKGFSDIETLCTAIGETAMDREIKKVKKHIDKDMNQLLKKDIKRDKACDKAMDKKKK